VRTEAPAEDQQTGVGFSDPETLAGSGTVCAHDLFRHRPSGDEIAVSGAARNRKRQADAARKRREQPVREAETAVRLGQHERYPTERGREAHGAGYVAAGCENGVRAEACKQTQCLHEGAGCAKDGNGGAERASAIETGDRHVLDRVTRRRYQLGLGALARADEDDLGALSPQLVGDRERRHHVAGGSPGCHHDLH
jgi:hypothetical protein